MAIIDFLFGSKDPAACNDRGMELQRKGDIRGAIAAFTRAIKLDPRFAVAYMNRGFARHSGQDFENAILDYSRAIELAPSFLAFAYRDRGVSRTHSGDIDGAIADYDEAIELDPGEGYFYFRRGLAWLEKLKFDAAVNDFGKSIALDPRCVDSLRNYYPILHPHFQRRAAELIENAGMPCPSGQPHGCPTGSHTRDSVDGHTAPWSRRGDASGRGLNLGSKSDPGSAAAGPTALEISSLPPPPLGFAWQPFTRARMTVLRPEGWYVHQVDSENFTGCVSKECIQTQGSFATGLTLHVIRGVKERLRQHNPNYHPDAPVMGILDLMCPDLQSDPRFQVLYLDQGIQRTPGSRLFRFRIRQIVPARPDIPWHQPIIIQKVIVEFGQSPDVYLFTFECPEDRWDESWKLGKQVLTRLVFSANPSTSLIFSIDPPLPTDDVLREKALEVGRDLGWSLAHESRREGLFIWRINLVVSRDGGLGSIHAGTFTWNIQREGNEIRLHDPINLFASNGIAEDFLEHFGAAARVLQEDFKRR
jgi:hypothetical protein